MVRVRLGLGLGLGLELGLGRNFGVRGCTSLPPVAGLEASTHVLQYH
jgi:hypothetical protein